MKRYVIRATSYDNVGDREWMAHDGTNYWIVAIIKFIQFGRKYDYVEMTRSK